MSVPPLRLQGAAGGLGASAGPSLQYACRNTFTITSTWRTPAALHWQTASGSASGQVTVPALGSAAFDASKASVGASVTIYEDAARTKPLASATNSSTTCRESTSGVAISQFTLAHQCGATFMVSNASERWVRIVWEVPGSTREGAVTVPPRTALAPGQLSFEVPAANAVRTWHGSKSFATVTVPTPRPACDEGPLLRWRLLAPATAAGGTIVQTAFVDNGDAIIATDGPDYGVGQLRRFDLASGTWSVIGTSAWPMGKFRNIVYDADNARAITYWDGLGQAYAVPLQGGSWTAIGSSGNSDSYYEGAAFWNPVTHAVNHWGGYGFGAFRNSHFALDASSGHWTSVSPSGVAPWPRVAASVSVDAAQERLFLAGGEGSSTGAQGAPDQQFLADLWMLDLTTNSWTEIVPRGSGAAYLRAPIAYVPGQDAVYRFGGLLNGAATNGLSRVSLGSPTGGFQPMRVLGALPPARYSFGLHHDPVRNQLVLVSGYANGAYLNDVWGLQLP